MVYTIEDVFNVSKGTFLFCSLAVLDQMIGHTMDVLSPFICLSD